MVSIPVHQALSQLVDESLDQAQKFRRLDAPEKLMQVYLEFGPRKEKEGAEIKREEVLAVA